MIHDPELLDLLSQYQISKFSGVVYRATRKNLDPLAVSSSGGRWTPPEEYAVLYTSLTREGALAEIVYHWSMLNPLPSKPVVVHKLEVRANKSIQLLHVDLGKLGVNMNDCHKSNYIVTQKIGAAVCFLGRDGLIVPSARWDSKNLILFGDSINSINMRYNESEEVEWFKWGEDNGLISK